MISSGLAKLIMACRPRQTTTPCYGITKRSTVIVHHGTPLSKQHVVCGWGRLPMGHAYCVDLRSRKQRCTRIESSIEIGNSNVFWNAGCSCSPVVPETTPECICAVPRGSLGYPQMDASFYLRTWDFLKAAGSFLDCIVARSIVAPDAACQNLGRSLWKEGKDRLPDTAWNANFKLAARYGNLASSVISTESWLFF